MARWPKGSFSAKIISQTKAEGSKKKSKYGASKVKPGEAFSYCRVNYINPYNETFDSKLEFYFYHRLKQAKIPFTFQRKWRIWEDGVRTKSILKGKNRKDSAMSVKIDFVFEKENTILLVDTKGALTAPAKIRYKMLRAVLNKDYEEIYFDLPTNIKQCKTIISELKKMLLENTGD